MAATLLSRRSRRLLERPLLLPARGAPRDDGGGFVLGAASASSSSPAPGPVLAAVTVLAASGEVGLRIVLRDRGLRDRRRDPDARDRHRRPEAAAGCRLRPRARGATRRVAGVVDRASPRSQSRSASTKDFTTALPGYTEAFQEKVERNAAAQRELRELTAHRRRAPPQAASARPTAAPEFRGHQALAQHADGKPLTLRELRGKVVLIDFWTYSCINCLRTLPHLKAWDRDVPRRRADDRRRPHARVRVRARARQRARAPSATSASAIRSRSTTTSRRGAPTRTSTGRPKYLIDSRGASATTTSARASTTRPRRRSARCSARR